MIGERRKEWKEKEEKEEKTKDSFFHKMVTELTCVRKREREDEGK